MGRRLAEPDRETQLAQLVEACREAIHLLPKRQRMVVRYNTSSLMSTRSPGMRRRYTSVAVGFFAAVLTSSLAPASIAAMQQPVNSTIPATYRSVADSLIHGATRDSAAYRRLGELVDGFGHRLSGSKSLESAIDWILVQ